MRSRFLLAALLSFGFAGGATAHSIWLEREVDGARIYFGEFDENLREASPGLLDRLKPEAKVAGSDKVLKVDKTAGFFAVAGPVGKDDSIVAENVAITERRGDRPTKVLTRLGARTVADFKEQAPVNTLDIVPAGKPGLFEGLLSGQAARQGQGRADRRVRAGSASSRPTSRARSRRPCRGVAPTSSRSRIPTPRPANGARRPMIQCVAPAHSSSGWPTASRARRSRR